MKDSEAIRKGTVEILTEDELKDCLKRKRPLRVKFGADPTVPDIHLGHTVVLQKLKQFQALGHKIIFVIGDFTARIGDPSGRMETRKPLSRKEVLRNARTYQDQIFKILDRKKTRVVFNSAWLDKLISRDIFNLASKYTVARMLERDDFSLRYKKEHPISIHEFLYPLIQGYDSIVLKADVEIGGTDQKFNMLVGRALQKEYGQKPQVVITMPLLEGTDGIRKMSKTYGNYIGISEPPKEIFGKLMSVSDELCLRYWELLTDISPSELAKMKRDLKSGRLHPKEVKKNLALKVVEMYHSKKAAKEAAEEFEEVFKKKKLPHRIQKIKIVKKKIWVVKLLTTSGMVKSSSEARRLIQQGAVTLDGEKITDPEKELIIREGAILKVGKRRFARIVRK
ncbi:tyrosine--tRNA ligase [bacterium]|nr:tyrosine--tRNA ligase [bacterium]MCG2676289.1 tyrosine--tRNA ligase [bacterium]